VGGGGGGRFAYLGHGYAEDAREKRRGEGLAGHRGILLGREARSTFRRGLREIKAREKGEVVSTSTHPLFGKQKTRKGGEKKQISPEDEILAHGICVSVFSKV